jgi:hypothetical protein
MGVRQSLQQFRIWQINSEEKPKSVTFLKNGADLPIIQTNIFNELKNRGQ